MVTMNPAQERQRKESDILADMRNLPVPYRTVLALAVVLAAGLAAGKPHGPGH
jgi:hypothetical protein